MTAAINFFFFSSRRRHTRCLSDWSSDVCSSDLRFAPPSERGDRREGGANLERNAGKDQLLASGRLDGGRDFRIVPRVDRGAIDDVLSSHHFHEFGEGRPPHAVAGRGGDNGWDP